MRFLPAARNTLGIALGIAAITTFIQAATAQAVGKPITALLQAAHLASPYPELWSLPVRVRDPRLTDLTAVLEGSSRPTWVVVDGASLGTWGVDPSLAQPVLDREYRLAHISGDWHVYHLRTEAR